MAQSVLSRTSNGTACRAARPRQGSVQPRLPVFVPRSPRKAGRLAPCRFRDATKEEVDVANWRRHFTEAEAPEENGGSGPGALIQKVKASMRDSPFSLVDLALPSLGALGSVALNDAHSWSSVAVGIAAGAAVRLLQQATLEQTVPFTLRKHSLLLPVFAELLLGQFSFSQVLQQPQYRGKALPPDHRDSKLIQKIAERIISAVEEGHGGGFQKHIRKFDWEVVVLDDPTVNAFVLPGGKIVVFTGLIKLMDRDEDMLATIIGHECAHAVARHSSEKISLGLFIALAVQLAAYAVQRSMSSGSGQSERDSREYQMQRQRMLQQQQQQQMDPRLQRRGYDPRFGPYPYQQNPYSNPYDNPYYNQRRPYSTSRGGRSIHYIFPEEGMAMGAAPRGMPPGYGRGRGAPGLGGVSPVGGLVKIATNLLLQLPFSRRAEAEADLIGLKLMAIAGYNADKAPTTFAKMEEYQGKMMGKAASNASYIQDHPRSANRVKLLEGELDMMKQYKEGKEVVLSKVPYWML
ncbi:peptidase family M48-domain-containing protein [Scenedesmus sp. NREL 46B-D3]|nr:peptidase family M48-domain-containing protein [Scenedesmus sp. NREL 46B-D3]